MDEMEPPMKKQKKFKKKRKNQLVISFDEQDRKKFLLGFANRKQERRKHALKELEIKAKQERLESRKRIREEIENDHQARMKLAGFSKDNEEEDEDPLTKEKKKDEENIEAISGMKAVSKSSILNDSFSKNAFGSGLVSVDVSYGIQNDDEDDKSTPAPAKPKKSNSWGVTSGKKGVKIPKGPYELSYEKLKAKMKKTDKKKRR